MKKSFVILLLAVLGFIGYVVYYGLHMLKEPLYIKQSQQLYFEGNTNLSFLYFGNELNHNDVISVSFPELKDPNIEYSLYNSGTYNEAGQYIRYYLNVEVKSIDSTIPTDLVLTQMNVLYSNGKKQTVHFGDVHLKSYVASSGIIKHKDGLIGTGVNMATFKVNFINSLMTTQDVDLVDILPHETTEFDELFPLSINGNIYNGSPLHFNKNESITVTMDYQFKMSDSRKCDIYKANKVLVFKNNNGQIDQVQLLNLGFDSLCYYRKDQIFYIQKQGKTYFNDIF